MARARNWIFTDNNPERHEPDWPDTVKYAIWQLERGAEGTQHLQGYVEFKHSTPLTRCKSILPRAHWEVRRGTQQQAIDYCSKQNTREAGPWTFGELALASQGARNDLLELKRAIDEGKREIELYEHSAMWKYRSSALAYRNLTCPRRDHITRVYLCIGPTGCGKTSFCKRVAPEAYWKFRSPGSNEWWDGYDRHSDVVIDEFYGWIKYDTLLRLIDSSPLSVEIKGGVVQFVARRLFITSNRDLDDWYPGITDKSALQRRIREFGLRVTDFNQNIVD
ncbi:Rep [Molossus molossus associated circovirus 1]|nr:Rep [Molossus molossus associated circovirus 1]